MVRYGRYIRLDQARINPARYLFVRFGGQIVFFGRFVAVLRTYTAFLAGTTSMAWRRFVVFNASGGILWATLYGLAAYMLGQQIVGLSRPLAIGTVVAGALAILFGVLLVRCEEGRLEAAVERALPGPLEGYPGGAPL